jgi:hypothetical protein
VITLVFALVAVALGVSGAVLMLRERARERDTF